MSAIRRSALVVGGTSGIGHGIAIALAKLGHDVTIAGRSTTAGETIVSKLEQISPQNNFAFAPVDGFDLSSVKDLASKYENEKLDYLVLTLGMATMQGYTKTKDGFDQKLQLHVYSRFLLAKLLSPTLSNSEDGRVLSVLSAGVHSDYKHYAKDHSLEKNYSIQNAANAAGVYNDVFLDGLAKEYPNVRYVHAAPGFVKTNWGTEMPWIVRSGIVRPMQKLFAKSKESCGESLLRGFLSTTDNQKGKLNLVDEHGTVGKATVTKGFEDSKETIWKDLNQAIHTFL